ncbi:MAG: gamma-glutamylcyclotransferase [Hyphomicrobiales bacterium]|nr:gamma-glutamylcyclotransferase [Hyphomicrobiales bacterium]MCP5371910.1 gamma-glutamylcyclotransferase [Hyphomicrobiales bacterium]
MTTAPDPDPFARHPELREHIGDPLQSFMRGFNTRVLAAKAAEMGAPTGWWYADDEREALRARALAGRGDGDLWVFGYGSLMWDPAFLFAEVRRARVPGHARRFILKDIYGGRGTAERPGLMAALDVDPRAAQGCEGLAFRIEKDRVEAETEILWRREQVGPAYTAVFVDAHTAAGPVTALTFVADHDATLINAGLTRDEQVRFLVTGTGFMGTSLDYLRNIARHFDALGIRDDEVADLLRAAEDFRE